MKKRVLALLLALVMLIGMTACAQKEAPKTDETPKVDETPKADETPDGPTLPEEWYGTEDGQTVTLKFYAAVQPEYGYDDLVNNFNEAYKDKGIQIEFTRYTNNDDGNLQLDTYLMTEGNVDVFIGYGNATRIANRIDSELVWDMGEALKAAGFDAVAEVGASAVNKGLPDYGDAVYGVETCYSNTGWMLVNATKFNEAGIEVPYEGWTYSEFLAAAEKLTTGEGQDKVYGVSFNINQSIAQIKACLGMGLKDARFFTDASKSTLNLDNDVWKDGFNMVMTSMENGWAIPIDEEVSEAVTVANYFVNGKCAMTVNASQLRICMDTAAYPHDFTTAVVPFPVPDAFADDPVMLTHAHYAGSSDTISIASNCQYKDAAVEFVRWYITGGMVPLTAKGARIPMWSGIDAAETAAAVEAAAGTTVDPVSMQHYLSIDKTQSAGVSVHALSAEQDTVWNEEFQAMCYGLQTVDETIENMMTRMAEVG